MKPEEWLKEAERLLSSAAGVRHPSGTPAGADSGEAVRARLAESASRAERWAERFRLANGIPNPRSGLVWKERNGFRENPAGSARSGRRGFAFAVRRLNAEGGPVSA